MKLPRDVSGDDPAKALKRFGYQIVRQKGSHIRLTSQKSGEHHVTIPRHDPLRIGTLTGILDSVANHLKMARSAVQEELFQ